MGILLKKLDVLGAVEICFMKDTFMSNCFVECVASVINGGFKHKNRYRARKPEKTMFCC